MRGRLRRQLATRPWRPLPLEPGAVHVQCSALPRPPWQECIEIETHSALWMARPRAPEPCLRQSRLSRQQESELAKSYSQLQAQIEKLQAEAEALKAKELEGVIARIRTAIEHYGITPDQLFGKPRRPWLAGLRPRRPRHASRPPRAVRWPSSTATVTTPGPAAATSRGGWSLGSPKASNSRTSPSAEYQGASVGHPGDGGLFWRGAAVPLLQPSRLMLAASGWAP
jgi:DNA-binding protein H-NS